MVIKIPKEIKSFIPKVKFIHMVFSCPVDKQAPVKENKKKHSLVEVISLEI